jgi:hypothetical protein
MDVPLDTRDPAFTQPAGRDPRAYFEELGSAFGLDFSGVTVRFDQGAALDWIGANAAAKDESVYFGTPNPSKQLVAHELSHVAQRRIHGPVPAGARAFSTRSSAAEAEAESLAPRAAAGERVSVRQPLSARVHLDEKTDRAEAVQRAKRIYAAFHDSIFTEDEEAALEQIRGQHPALLRAIRAQYQQLFGRVLEVDFEKYCSSKQTKEAMSLLQPAMTLGERLDTQVEKGPFDLPLMNGAGVLSLLRSASGPERAALAKDPVRMLQMRRQMSSEEYYEAQKLVHPNGDLYEAVLQRLSTAHKWSGYDAQGAANAILALSPSDRARLWNEHGPLMEEVGAIFGVNPRILCLGTEAEALKERMRFATEGAGALHSRNGSSKSACGRGADRMGSCSI